MVSQVIQTRPIQLSAAVAIIAVDMCFRQVPVRLLRHVGLQSLDLLLNGLRLLRSLGRHTGIHGHFHDRPPEGGMVGWPSPTAEGTGRRSPNAVAHRRVT